MINKTYDKKCDVGKLQSEIIATGYPVYPNAGARFYGCNCDQQTDNSWVTTVMCYDDISAGEVTAIDAIVAAHIPIPLPSPPIDVEETVIFNGLEIRDTDEHISSTSTNIGYRVKTLIITNTLDQIVTLHCQGSRDGTNWFDIGDEYTVAAGVSAYQSCETYFPYLRAEAQCEVTPTSGALDMWVEKMGV